MNRIRSIILLSAVMILVSACATKIPITAVQLSDNDGSHSSSITKRQIERWVKQANRTWKKRGYKITFRGKKDIVRVRSTLLNTQPPDSDDSTWEIYRIAGNYLASELPAGRIPVFFRGRGNSAWSWGPGNTNFISMPDFDQACTSDKGAGTYCHHGCCTDLTLLSHELGHYFGLAHTFTDADCDKLTKENSNGDLRGQVYGDKADNVTDTASDPSAGCLAPKSRQCSGSVTVNGVTFHPPWHNLMSNHACLPKKISDDQAKVIEHSFKQPWRQQLGK
jgi:hypothetical protein